MSYTANTPGRVFLTCKQNGDAKKRQDKNLKVVEIQLVDYIPYFYVLRETHYSKKNYFNAYSFITCYENRLLE